MMSARKALLVLMLLYGLAFIFAFVAFVPMVAHVSPRSECLLFSSQSGDKLYYGHHSSCRVAAYSYLVVILGAIYLFTRCYLEIRRLKNNHLSEEKIPNHIVLVHVLTTLLVLLLCAIVTAGYVTACNNLHSGVRKQVNSKFNVDPNDARGEEIQTRFEDDYKFHRYTKRYGNAFGAEFYKIRITCRSIMTDPEIHQRLHDSHYELQSRYYGYWYGQDLFAYDSQSEASKNNALIESSLAGNWLTFVFWFAGLGFIFAQKHFRKKRKMEQDRISTHSAMMGSMYQGDASMAGSTFRRDGSLISGKGSAFNRGGSRGSDRSIRSSRRDIDDLALSNILKKQAPPMAATSMQFSQPGTSYGRKDVDDMVINQFIAQNAPSNAQTFHYPAPGPGQAQMPQQGGYFNYSGPSSRGDPGYASDIGSQPVTPGTQSGHFQYNPIPVRQTADATYLSRDEVETEIF